MSLDFSTTEFRQLLDKTSELVIRQFEKLPQLKGYNNHSQAEVASWFDETLPETGIPLDELLQEVKEKVLDTATGNLGPHMYAYVMSGGTQVSIAAEKLANTVNQNLGKWHLGPSMNEIEQRVVQWGKEMIGFPGEGGGITVSGGSAANLVGLTVARNVYFEQLGIRQKGLFGMKPFTVYASKEVHGCVPKSLDVLGIGTDNLRKTPTNKDFTIDVAALEKQIIADQQNGFQPFCIIGNAGTVNTGAIDDLTALAKLAQKYDMWYHIDGAYGGLAAALPSIKAKYKGIELADSVAIDFHKWLYQPFEAGCILVKDWSILRRAYFTRADYLEEKFEQKGRLDLNEHHFQLSRNSKAFKVWMSVKAYGFARIRAMIQKDIDLAKYLADQVEKTPDFRLKARSELAITCFQYIGKLKSQAEIIDFNERLIPALEKDGRVFIMGTKLNGEFALRACFINHRKTEATTDYLLSVIRDVAEQLVK